MLIFEKKPQQSGATGQIAIETEDPALPKACVASQQLRVDVADLPAVSELEVVQHYTRLSQQNFSIDTHFYPLGSCTMKYNPRAAHQQASLPGFTQHHPLAGACHSQGVLACLFELQQMLKEVTHMHAAALSPMAGAQGEFVGVAMIRAYHLDRGDVGRCEMLVPDSAHGTNPASAVMCGYQIKEIKTADNGDLDLNSLEQALSEKTAGIMLTNPSTLGLFEQNIEKIAAMVHEAGGLLYYDGANLNALLGRTFPGDMQFDVLHLNLHKTFSTPHGGGGPGGGPVLCCERLAPYLPVPRVAKQDDRFVWLQKEQAPKSIGAVTSFAGNVGVMLRAYIYLRLLGADGLKRVSQFATLNANYLKKRLQDIGIPLAYPNRMATHEFVVSFSDMLKKYNLSARDFAKRLLDYDIHAPTIYFPLLVLECWLIEPTETASKETLDQFVSTMVTILKEAKTTPEKIKTAPQNLPVQRLDEVRAVKNLDVAFLE